MSCVLLLRVLYQRESDVKKTMDGRREREEGELQASQNRNKAASEQGEEWQPKIRFSPCL